MSSNGRRLLIVLGGLATTAAIAGAMFLNPLWPATAASDVPARTTAIAAQTPTAKADLQRATWDELHRFPQSASASDQACLTCHQEVLEQRPRAQSPAGLKSSDALAWYQTLDTYAGEQETFHWRHARSPLAQTVMNLGCSFCHQANDPREESPHAMRTTQAPAAGGPQPFQPPFNLRRTVNTAETCLRCHGAFPAEAMGLPEPWHEMRDALESAETPNGCLSCHAENFRTVRHNVTYLKAAGIEQAAQTSSDTCYGCHGGRAWYRISYPYPRTPWPNMPDETPDWAKDRPRQSDPRFALPRP